MITKLFDKLKKKLPTSYKKSALQSKTQSLII